MFSEAFVDKRKLVQFILLYFLNYYYDQGKDEAQPKEDSLDLFFSMPIYFIPVDNKVVSHHRNNDRVKGYNVRA